MILRNNMWYTNPEWWTVISGALAIGGAVWIGIVQKKINKAIHRTQDTVELYASFAIRQIKDKKDNITSQTPLIYVQNVGTRLIYLDKYIFNGKTYNTDGQVLPSTYSQALDNFYWIELPTNGETHVFLEVYYHDLENRGWKSVIIADLENNIWKIKTLPREEYKNYA